MYDLQPRAFPWRERRRLLAASEIAPQVLSREATRDLLHLAAGTHAFTHLSIRRGLMAALRGCFGLAAYYAVASRLSLLAAVWVSSRIFTPGNHWTQAVTISCGYLMCQLASGFWLSRSEYTKGQLSLQSILYLTTRINTRIIALDPQAAGTWTSGQLKNLLSTDVKYFAEYASGLAVSLLPALASMLLLGPMIFSLAGWPGTIGIITSFAYIPFAVMLGERMRRATDGQQVHMDALSTTAGEWLRNVRLSRYLGWQQAFETKIGSQVRLYVRALISRHVLACITFGISFTWWMVPVIAMLVTSRLQHAPLNLVAFFATLWVIKDLNDSLQHLPHTISVRAAAVACLARIAELEAAPMLVDRFVPLPAAARLPAADAVPVALHLDGVAFAYTPETPVIARLTLHLDLTQRTAIVGSVGCGKTTLLRLICGELAPTAGSISVVFSDGACAPLWHEPIYHRYRSLLAFVPQEPFIANTTLGLNISLRAGDAGDDPVQAAYMAELLADIALLPKGFAELIGEAGVNLSGGQRQRVNLARAFHSGRTLLCLDDPLSAVDEATETKLMAHVVGSPAAFVLVSHRLAELRAASRMLVMARGSIVEDGATAALWADSHSLFSRLREADLHA